MKLKVHLKKLLIAIVLFMGLNVYTQSSYAGYTPIVTVGYIMRQPLTEMHRDFPDTENLMFYQAALPLGFDSAELLGSKTLRQLKSKAIYKAELYYSSYKSSKNFSQEELNQKRLEALLAAWPELFDNNVIEWKLVKQVENNEEKAKKLFHGFIFYSREPLISTTTGDTLALTTKGEIEIIKNYLDDYLPAGYIEDVPIGMEERCDSLYKSTYSGKKNKTTYTGKYLPKSKRKREKGILYNKRSIWKRKREYKVEPVDTYTGEVSVNCYKIFTAHYPDLPFGKDDISRFSITKDSVVLQTLHKNNWKNALIVEDVTGSMYPYLGQTFKWRRLQIAAAKNKNFAFFNDGDAHPDGPLGNSGGIYYQQAHNIDTIENTAYKTMELGRGGNTPENNIEAMLKGVEKNTGKIDCIILVADNLAPVRDIMLLPKLTALRLPVHVIVCGAINGNVHYHYINIARETNGSIHTLNEQLYLNSKLAEGEILTIGGQTFVVHNGMLVLR